MTRSVEVVIYITNIEDGPRVYYSRRFSMFRDSSWFYEHRLRDVSTPMGGGKSRQTQFGSRLAFPSISFELRVF